MVGWSQIRQVPEAGKAVSAMYLLVCRGHSGTDRREEPIAPRLAGRLYLLILFYGSHKSAADARIHVRGDQSPGQRGAGRGPAAQIRQPATERTVNTCIIIAEVVVDNQTSMLGALADAVQEVIDLEPGHIEPAPEIGARLNTEFMTGMGRRDSSFLIILDIDKLFSPKELEMVQETDQDMRTSG